MPLRWMSVTMDRSVNRSIVIFFRPALVAAAYFIFTAVSVLSFIKLPALLHAFIMPFLIVMFFSMPTLWCWSVVTLLNTRNEISKIFAYFLIFLCIFLIIFTASVIFLNNIGFYPNIMEGIKVILLPAMFFAFFLNLFSASISIGYLNESSGVSLYIKSIFRMIMLFYFPFSVAYYREVVLRAIKI